MAQFRLKKLKYSALFPNTHVFGFEEMMENLQLEVKKIEGASIQGLIKAAAMIREDTERTPYITPLDLGNLRSSWFVTTAQGKMPNDKWNTGFRNVKREKGSNVPSKLTATAARMATDHVAAVAENKARCVSAAAVGRIMLVMGYSAHYAVYVHENVEAKFKRSGSGAKWFQEAVYRNRDKVLDVIRKNVIIMK